MEPEPLAQVRKGISLVGGAPTTSPWEGVTTALSCLLSSWLADCSFVSCSMVVLLEDGFSDLDYLARPVKTNQRLSVAARRSQPPHGLMPKVNVTRLMTSPRPISSSLTNPGRRTR